MGRCFEPEYVVRVVAALDLDEPVVLRSVGGSGAVVVTIQLTYRRSLTCGVSAPDVSRTHEMLVSFLAGILPQSADEHG